MASLYWYFPICVHLTWIPFSAKFQRERSPSAGNVKSHLNWQSSAPRGASLARTSQSHSKNRNRLSLRYRRRQRVIKIKKKLSTVLDSIYDPSNNFVFKVDSRQQHVAHIDCVEACGVLAWILYRRSGFRWGAVWHYGSWQRPTVWATGIEKSGLGETSVVPALSTFIRGIHFRIEFVMSSLGRYWNRCRIGTIRDATAIR